MVKHRLQQPKPEIWKIDLVQQHVARAADWLAAESRQGLIEEMHAAVHEMPIHSPIEAVFLAWWDAIEHHEFGKSGVADGLSLTPQVVVSTPERMCRPDFIVWPKDVDLMFEGEAAGIRFQNIAIELDGHEFHERTKEQVTDRNQRDRSLQQAGWTVFHFSGSELVKDPERCVREVLTVAQDAFWRLSNGVRRYRQQSNRASEQPMPATEA